jgi:phosphohistidine phosphatase
MYLILVQHGEAMQENQDPTRPLSVRGAEQCDRMGRFLSRLPFKPERVYHSGKLRAVQTAERAARAIGVSAIEPQEGLGPNDSVDDWAERLRAYEEDLMIAGHMPFMGRLASVLLECGDARSVIDFFNASPCILKRTERGFVLYAFVRNDYC